MDIVLRESERLNQTIKSFLAYARPQRVDVEPLDVRRAGAGDGDAAAQQPRDVARITRSRSTCRQARCGRRRRGPDPADHLEPRHQRPAGDAARRHACWLFAAAEHGDGAASASRDEGVGIPPEDVDAIFQPFRGSFGKGTGLGLAIVHRIVTDYNGRIDVSPPPGRGTTISRSFPAPRRRGVRLPAPRPGD